MNAWLLTGFGVNVAMVFMAIVWFVCKKLNNASFVDVAWSYGFALLTLTYAAIGQSAPLRKGLIVAMVLIWSLRLGTYLFIRVAKHHPAEDSRYVTLRESFPKRPWLMFLGFFLLQGLLLGFLSAPFAVACTNPAPGLHLLEILGAALWLVGFAGESVADAQLERFRKDPANKGRVCDTGLWRYSRHPNYFFEWVIWIGFFVFASGSPWGWLTFFCPLVMLHFLLNVTGVPPAEAQSLKSRGDAYRAYQAATSVFLPMPRKKPKGAMVRVPDIKK